MDFRGFQEYKPGASRYNGRISEDEWNRHKPKLRELHDAKYTRQQILDIISKDFGDIKPTYGQLCTKFEKWGFTVYRTNERKDATTRDKKGQKKNTKTEQSETIAQVATPESSNGSTIVPDMTGLDINDRLTPVTFGTPQPQFLETSSVSDTTPKPSHSRHTSEQVSTPPLGTIYEPDASTPYQDYPQQPYSDGGQAQPWLSVTSSSTTTASHGNRSSLSDTTSTRTSFFHTISELVNAEPDDPVTIAARTQKADDALEAVGSYLRSVGSKGVPGEHITTMISLAAYLFATRSYTAAFRIYRRIYDIMSQDMDANEISRFGALMRCYQSAIEPGDLDFMQKELHFMLSWNFDDSSISTCVASMLQSVETQIMEGFNLAQGAIMSTSSITRELSQLMVKGTESTYPGTRRLYWRLRLLKHSPFHSGCKRLLRLMSELLSWAWAAMAVLKFPEAAVQTPGCLCKDGLYFDFVRMVTTVILEAAVGFEISQLIRLPSIRSAVECDCIMCADLEATFDYCPIETFTAISLLTVDRCRLDWTSCHPGGRHQELAPQVILKEHLLPTVDSLLDQVAADLRLVNAIHTSDLYDDFLSSLWSTFETHDLPLKNARFDASAEKVEDMMTTLITEELNKSHPARNSTLDESRGEDGKMPVFSYGEQGNEELASKITAKRTRSNASSLKPSSSNASERSMIRIRKKLKFRTSADYLNSMSSYSSLSSRNSLNRFSYVTGLPELETTLEDEEFDPRDLPPDLTPDEFRAMQKHDSWSRRSDHGHFSWVPSRSGSQVSRTMSWRESSVGMPSSRPASTIQNGINRRSSQKEVVPNPSPQVMQTQIQGVGRVMNQQVPQAVYAQNTGVFRHPSGSTNQSIYQQYQQQQFAQQQQQQQQQYAAKHYQISSNHSQSMPPPQMNPAGHHPARKNSAKSTRSKESTKGRWSSEAERVERILRMTQ